MTTQQIKELEVAAKANSVGIHVPLNGLIMDIQPVILELIEERRKLRGLLGKVVANPKVYESLGDSAVGCVFCGSIEEATADTHWHQPDCIISQISKFITPRNRRDRGMSGLDYWRECVSVAADECGLVLTEEQLKCITESVEGGHENYGMAFYSPPASDRIADIEREWKAKLAKQEQEAERYRKNAEKAIKRALNQFPDSNVSIGEHGEVFRHGGRTTQIL